MNNLAGDARPKRQQFPCPTCGELKRIKFSKKDKPYFICEECGLQTFIRGAEGIRRLYEIAGDTELNKILEGLSSVQSAGFIQLQNKISRIRSEIQRLAQSEFLFENESAAKLELKSKLESLEHEFHGLLISGEKPINS
jgi:hypothetical protein